MSEWELPASVESVSIERTGGGFTWDSNVYDTVIKLIYLDQAETGAVSFNVVLQNADNQELKERMFIKSGDKKGNKTFYTKDGKDYPLPGYSAANSLCVAAVGLSLAECMAKVEKKTIKVYDFKAQKEVAKERPVMVPLIGAKVKVAVKRIKENKKEKGADGNYKEIADTREINECAFFGNEAGFTAEEILSKAETPEKFEEWAAKNAGKTIDKSKKDVGTPGSSAADIMGNNTASDAPAAGSLFS